MARQAPEERDRYSGVMDAAFKRAEEERQEQEQAPEPPRVDRAEEEDVLRQEAGRLLGIAEQLRDAMNEDRIVERNEVLPLINGLIKLLERQNEAGRKVLTKDELEYLRSYPLVVSEHNKKFHEKQRQQEERSVEVKQKQSEQPEQKEPQPEKLGIEETIERVNKLRGRIEEIMRKGEGPIDEELLGRYRGLGQTLVDYAPSKAHGMDAFRAKQAYLKYNLKIERYQAKFDETKAAL